MIDEYKFYYSYNEYVINNPEELFIINDHQISQEVYEKLYAKISKNYELYTTQYCNWTNHISKAHAYSKLEVFKRKENLKMNKEFITEDNNANI